MIDFHSHILPGVDDGSRDIEESIAMIKEAKKAGFDKIILTSHYIEDYYKSSVAERKEILEKLKKRVAEEKIDIELCLGNELFITSNVLDLLKKGEICTQCFSRYVLFELPFNNKPLNVLEVINNIKRQGMIPVLAHPERYSYFYKNPEEYNELSQEGVLFQVNFGSLLGQYGSRAEIIARYLIECNMVYFFGSDVHRPNSIYPRIHEAIDIIEDLIGKEKTIELTDINPKLVLINAEIEMQDDLPITYSFSEKVKMNRKHKK
jgi:protein-tyrosine phosphatase